MGRWVPRVSLDFEASLELPVGLGRRDFQADLETLALWEFKAFGAVKEEWDFLGSKVPRDGQDSRERLERPGLLAFRDHRVRQGHEAYLGSQDRLEYRESLV